MTSFEQLGLSPALIAGLAKQNIEKPTPIQEAAIPEALSGKDVIGKAQTGSGKTLAYLLPIFQRLNAAAKEMQAIILAPTHELAIQIEKQAKLLSENAQTEVTSIAIIGDVNIERQIEKLRTKPHIIIGSGGRILELIKRKKITAHTVKTIVIDESDRLLDIKNIDVIKDIVKSTLKDRQLMVFSATMSEAALNTANALMKEAVYLNVAQEEKLNPKIKHSFFISEQRDKIEILRKLIAAIKPEKAMVFINKGDDTLITAEKLQYHKIKAHGINGSVTKDERKEAIEGFRSGKYNILVASDIAARGLDVPDVTHIFNLDVPEQAKDYLHRAGRTGRMNKSGDVVTMVTVKEIPLIKKYEKELGIKIFPKEIYKGIIHDLVEASKEEAPKRQ